MVIIYPGYNVDFYTFDMFATSVYYTTYSNNVLEFY